MQQAKYSWEFLRRNKKYVRDWTDFFSTPTLEKAIELLNKWGLTSYPQSHDFSQRWEDIERKHPRLVMPKEYGTAKCKELMDEALSRVLYESTRNLFRPVLNTFLICRPQEGGCPDGLDPSLEPGYYMIQFPSIFQPRIRPIPVDKDNIPNEITITLTNFQNYVDAKARDKAFYRQWCTDYIAKQLVLWEEVSKEMGLHKETRRQFKLYDKYLEVWDLVQQKGKHWTEIAKVVYPKDFISESEQLESEYEPNPESAVEKVQQHYKTACELIRNAMRFRDPIVGVLTGEDALQE